MRTSLVTRVEKIASLVDRNQACFCVSGANKREPLGKQLRREITTELWLHPNWTLLCDRDAATGLDLKT
jgi:6-phosphogluconolactonase/glucosamine-6-phosphate isomerase/deaminase